MSEKTRPKVEATKDNETEIFDPQTERMHLCLEAAWEIDKLARIMPGLVPLDEDQGHLVVRGLCGRMLRLTSFLMNGLGDKSVPNEDMEKILYFELGQG